MTKKLYGYTYDGSAMAAQRPLTREKILKQMAYSSYPEKFQVYELVPVTRVPITVVTDYDFKRDG